MPSAVRCAAIQPISVIVVSVVRPSPAHQIALLEEKIRNYCVEALDPLVGTGAFDFVTDLGAVMPMKTISALIGIPEGDQEKIRDHVTSQMKTEAGKPIKAVAVWMVHGVCVSEYHSGAV